MGWQMADAGKKRASAAAAATCCRTAGAAAQDDAARRHAEPPNLSACLAAGPAQPTTHVRQLHPLQPHLWLCGGEANQVQPAVR